MLGRWLKTYCSKRWGWLIGTGSVYDVLQPDFEVFTDGSDTPTIGNNSKSFTRSGSIYYWNTKNTVLSVAADVAEANAYASHRLGFTSTKKGVLIHGTNRNEAQYANQFNQWTAIGTVTVTSNTATAPDGTTTADRLQCDSGEGLQLSLVQLSTEFPGSYATIGLGIKAVTGTPTIKLRVKDSGGNYWTNESHPNGFTVDSNWVYYEGWGKTPDPGSGALIYEITASGGSADVYLAFANLQFTGQAPDWDHHSLGHIPSYMADAGASRESTGKSILYYTASQLTGSITEYTVNQWVFLPEIDLSNYGYGFYLFSTEDSGGTSNIELHQDNITNVTARFGSTTPVTDTDHSFRTMARGRWAMITYALKSGDNAIYMDGQPFFTNTDAVAATTVDYFSPGQFDRSAATANTCQAFGWPMGQTQVWKRRLSSTEIAQLYTNQAGTDMLESPTQYNFPTSGATDVVRFNHTSGNATSLVQSLTLTKNNAFEYLSQGMPGNMAGSGLKGNYFKSNAYYDIASLPVAYNIGALENFVFMIQVYIPPAGASGEMIMFDCSDYGSATDGFMALIGNTNVDFFVYSGGSGHLSRWAHSDKIWADDKLYTLRWVFDRANDSANLYYKAAGETEVGPIATTRVLSLFSSLGAITVSTSNMRFGMRSNSTTLGSYSGNMYQWAFAKNTTTYDATTKP